MFTDFDEMDIEPKSELPPRKSPPFEMDVAAKIDKSYDEELQSQLLLRTVPLDDGNIGYVFTCTKNGPLAMWRCHACNFVDSWKNLVKHIESSWHNESMSKFQHARSNFSKVENAIPDISKGQPLPPGMEDIIAGPCQIWKTLENYDHPLIGLEFLLELNMIELKEPRYLCLLCDKRGDPRSILVHLTSQSHYLIYLRKYFKSFSNRIDELLKSILKNNQNDSRSNVSTVTSHLIAKLEEKYGRLQPTATREDVINVPEQRTIILQKIDSGIHFVETPEDQYLKDMLTSKYVENTSLLLKDFPLKPKLVEKSKSDENSKSLFHKSRGGISKKSLRHRNTHDLDPDDSSDVVFVPSNRPKYDRRSRELSPRSRSRSYRSSRSPDHGRRRHMSPSYYRSGRHRSRSYSPRRRHSRSPYDRYRHRSPPYRSSHSSRYGHHRHTPDRHHRRSPSPDIRKIYSTGYREHSRSRSHHKSRERSPHHRPRKSRSPKPSSREVSKSGRPHGDGPGANNKSKERHEENTFAFCKEMREIQEKLNKDMERYAETPENHPAYQEEWKKFWCNRYKELQTEGKVDPASYDYKPEWIAFWNIRVKELYNQEVNEKRKELKIKYGLPEEENTTGMPKKDTELVSSTTQEEGKKPVVDIKTMWKELTGFEIKEEPTKKTISPWEDDNDDDDKSKAPSFKPDQAANKAGPVIENDAQPISPEPLSSISDSESRGRSTPRRSYSRSRSNSRSRSRSRSKRRSYSREREFKEEYHSGSRKPSKKIHFENPLNIITVLRQLSVLEFQLGSYASHVITLLSSGLAMERVKPQSSVDLLTKENVIFLELVKEKLKGQLLAGVVQKSMVKATLFCIKNIEELLLIVPKLKPTAPPPVPAPPPALLYGAGVDAMATGPPPMSYGHPAPPPAPPHPHMYHPYGMPPGYKPPHPMKMYDREFGKYKPERYPFRKTSPNKKTTERQPFSSGKEEFPFADNEKDKKEAPPAPEPILIDKVLIATKIAEVLTAQGRTDVSEEELQSLINTVVESLKRDGGKDPEALAKSLDSLFSRNNPPAPAPPAAVPAVNQFPANNDMVTIPDGFDLNNVSSSTLAILQDAYANVSSVNANKTFNIEQLPDSELIQLLRNFKNIPRFKQEKLIEYLRKLEDTNPERVEELKKYVNVL